MSIESTKKWLREDQLNDWIEPKISMYEKKAAKGRESAKKLLSYYRAIETAIKNADDETILKIDLNRGDYIESVLGVHKSDHGIEI